MKKILIILVVFICIHGNAQMNNDWYAFRGNDLVYTTITPKYLITGQIIGYSSTREYRTRVDTFTIQKRYAHDSVLYISIFSVSDSYPDADNIQQTHKFIYHAAEHFLSAAPDTLAKDGLVRFYPMESLVRFTGYKKLTEHPVVTLIALFHSITSAYNQVKSLDHTTRMQYAALGTLMTNAIETPVYINMKICPLLRRDHMDEDEIKEKYINNTALMIAMDNLQKARIF